MTLKLVTMGDLRAEARRVLDPVQRRGIALQELPPFDGPRSVAAVQEAVRSGAADLGLVPYRLPAREVETVAVLARAEPHDVIVSAANGLGTLTRLGSDARVGLAGARRLGLLRAHRPDVQALSLSNGHTPASALESGVADALVLGAAEARRLGLAARITELLDPRTWLPAPGQGAVLVLARVGDGSARAAASVVDDVFSHRSWRCELALAAALGAGSDAPLGALAMPFRRWIRLWGMVTSADGTRAARADLTGSLDDPEALGTAVADLLLMRGAGAILAGSPQ